MHRVPMTEPPGTETTAGPRPHRTRLGAEQARPARHRRGCVGLCPQP
jgi:hypothetical protein